MEFTALFQKSKELIDNLSAYLTEEYGKGFSRSNVAGMRQFYMTYKDRENEIIQSQIGQLGQGIGISYQNSGLKSCRVSVNQKLQRSILCNQAIEMMAG